MPNQPHPVHRNRRWTCGAFRAEQIRPIDRHMVEAIMLVATLLRDENGKKVYHRMPPALAMAILHVMRQVEPQKAAHELVYGRAAL